MSSKSSGGGDRDDYADNKKIKSYEESFNRELIQPCNCNEKWHRVCIREKITKNMKTVCDQCQFQYVAGYTECYALFNKKRKNYLAYMLWQETIFFVAFLLLAGFTSFTVIDAVRRGIPFMRTQWVIYLQTFSAFIFILVVGLFIFRIRGLYCYREIEEIQIFDKSQKSSLDYESPAILEVYFEDIREY